MKHKDVEAENSTTELKYITKIQLDIKGDPKVMTAIAALSKF